MALRRRFTGELNTALARSRTIIALIAILPLALAASCSNDPSPLVFAAASMSDVLAEIADSYRMETGRDVRFSLGGSKALAVQIADFGAPADAVVFAGETPFEALERAEVIDPDGRIDILTNRLVVASRGEKISGLADLAGKSGGLVAIADPMLAPAGEYAIAALEHAGVLDDLNGRTVRTLDVRAALAAVSSGNARFAIAYVTDVLAVDGVEIAAEIPQDYYPPIVYPAAIIKHSDAEDSAARFIEYLQTERAREIFERHGFLQPG